MLAWLARLLEGASERRRETTIPFVTSPHGALTLRENSIASYAVRGLMNKEIARALSISDKTVKTHMSRILHKLGLTRRQQLVFGTAIANASYCLCQLERLLDGGPRGMCQQL